VDQAPPLQLLEDVGRHPGDRTRAPFAHRRKIDNDRGRRRQVVTGRRPAWSGLGLWAVKADVDGGGMFFAAFDSTVRLVFVGADEISPATLRAILGVHALALAVLVAALLWWSQRGRDTPTAPAT
jgi:hypothetical protein